MIGAISGATTRCCCTAPTRRSHAAIKAWKAAHPGRPLLLLLTGTDLYRDIRRDAQARESLRLADRMVVLQTKGLDELNATQRAKTRVIFQSVRAVARQARPKSYFLATVIGHLREEKDPFRAALALARAEPRYRWLGKRYPAYFPFADERALAALLSRAQSDPAWLAALESAVRKRRHEGDPATERGAIARLLDELPGARLRER